MSIFGHANGFYSKGQFMPREIAFANIRDPEDVYVSTIRMENVPLSSKDRQANWYATEYVHHLKYPEEEEEDCLTLDEWINFERTTRLNSIIYVKGEDQKKFFARYFRIVCNIEKYAHFPKFDELEKDVSRHIPPPIDHHRGIHISNNMKRCSAHVAYWFARTMQKKLEFF